MSDLRERVRAERRRRGWSVRAAAGIGGCSNTSWGEWEDGKRELGQAVQAAVAVAFDWPQNWPDAPAPTVSSDSLADLEATVTAMRADVEALRSEVDVLRAEAARLRGVGRPPRRRAGPPAIAEH